MPESQQTYYFAINVTTRGHWIRRKKEKEIIINNKGYLEIHVVVFECNKQENTFNIDYNRRICS